MVNRGGLIAPKLRLKAASIDIPMMRSLIIGLVDTAMMQPCGIIHLSLWTGVDAALTRRAESLMGGVSTLVVI